MGKKRIIKKAGYEVDAATRSRTLARLPKKKFERGVLRIEATYNNTRLALADTGGNVVFSASSGSLGFSGAKKGTPFAAGKVGELIASKAEAMGVKEVDVIIKGVGSGRESSIRAFAAHNVSISSIKDMTPVPFNGPRPKKPRRV